MLDDRCKLTIKKNYWFTNLLKPGMNLCNTALRICQQFKYRDISKKTVKEVYEEIPGNFYTSKTIKYT